MIPAIMCAPNRKHCIYDERQKLNTSQVYVMHVLHQHVLNHCKFLLMAVPMPPLHLRHCHSRRQPEKQRGIFEAFACLPIAFSFIGTIAGG
jgi:hypothetical protein